MKGTFLDLEQAIRIKYTQTSRNVHKEYCNNSGYYYKSPMHNLYLIEVKMCCHQAELLHVYQVIMSHHIIITDRSLHVCLFKY